MRDDASRGPGVPFPPPILFVAGLLAAWLIDRRVVSLRLVPVVDTPAIIAIGFGVALLGVALVLWGMLTFVRARTAIIPMRPASQLVQAGPYRFTRNPMYTGLTFVYLGVATMMNSVWPLLLLPFVLFALYRLVVRREEKHLAEAFGADYAAYTQRVRRWL